MPHTPVCATEAEGWFEPPRFRSFKEDRGFGPGLRGVVAGEGQAFGHDLTIERKGTFSHPATDRLRVGAGECPELGGGNRSEGDLDSGFHFGVCFDVDVKAGAGSAEQRAGHEVPGLVG
jgi:hypothetical protein